MPRRGIQAQQCYTLRIEYTVNSVEAVPPETKKVLRGWHRDFQISGKATLEQLSSVILQVLDWDPDHLYEFRIRERIYVYFGDDELFVDAKAPCMSCDIPMHLLGLARGDTFTYIFDFGDYHSFRLTVLDIDSSLGRKKLPAVTSHKGKNLIQYPGTMSRKEAKAFRQKTPKVCPLGTRTNTWRVRFIRAADRNTLKEWRKSNDKKLWEKAVTVLESWNLMPEEIAKKVERPLDEVRKWIKAFNRGGIGALNLPRKPRLDAAQRREALEQKRRRILEIVHDRPNSYGINRSNWNLPSLALAYRSKHEEAISRSTAGRLLKKSEYSIRKARKVLSSPDPDYREKVELLLNTLHSLKANELFFFVDELGPLRVKKYGGRTFVGKNEPCSIPQNQPARGVVTMAGALSATTNQVTWLYGPSKDTSEMIDLIEVLFNQHRAAARLYISWDAASWHRSSGLVEWLDAFNAETRKSQDGPLIYLVPLPTSSQFLDVIEAVFSGMKRAVIHHSNYRSEEDMKAAISQHFVQRNAYFLANPKRAGQKIWELDFFADHDNLRYGDYREW
jgi:transposase